MLTKKGFYGIILDKESEVCIITKGKEEDGAPVSALNIPSSFRQASSRKNPGRGPLQLGLMGEFVSGGY